MMSQTERNYWQWKELVQKLPPLVRTQIEEEWTYRDNSMIYQFGPIVIKHIKTLSKLEQLIYTNEIQGE